MNIKSRLLKLEKTINQNVSVLVMFKPDGDWTPEQQRQLDEARAKESHIIIVNFV